MVRYLSDNKHTYANRVATCTLTCFTLWSWPGREQCEAVEENEEHAVEHEVDHKEWEGHQPEFVEKVLLHKWVM